MFFFIKKQTDPPTVAQNWESPKSENGFSELRAFGACIPIHSPPIYINFVLQTSFVIGFCIKSTVVVFVGAYFSLVGAYFSVHVLASKTNGAETTQMDRFRPRSKHWGIWCIHGLFR